MADDFSANTSTTGRITVDTFFPTAGNIEAAFDHDWFRVWLWEGHTYTITQITGNGGTLADTVVALRDSSGNLLVTDDDSGGNLQSYARYVAATSGFYYVDAAAFGNDTGTYRVGVFQQADHFSSANQWGAGATATDRLSDVTGATDGPPNFRADLVQIYNGNVYVAAARENGFGSYQFWGSGATSSDRLVDVNSDGRNDLVQTYNGNAYVSLSTGTGFGGFTNWHTSGVQDNARFVDVNGDARADLVQITSGGAVQVALSNGINSFGAFVTSNIGATATDQISSGSGNILIANFQSLQQADGESATDFNGDNRADLLQFYNGNAYVALASNVTPGQFNAFTVWGSGVTSSDRAHDMNNDGRADLVQIYNGSVYVSLATGANSFGGFSNWGSGATSADQIRDVNGDGRGDVFQIYQGRAYVALAEGGTSNHFAEWQIWADDITGPVQFGDVEGDGGTDLVQIGANGGVDVYASQWVPGHDQFTAMIG